MRSVDLGMLPSAPGAWTWDGRGDAGKKVGSAVCYVRFQAGDVEDRRTLIRVE